MQAVVMAGGHGRRLRPHTDILPKPLTPVGEMPVIEIALRRMAAQGVGRAVVCTGVKARLIEAYLDTVPDLGLAVVFREDREPQGTAGALRDLGDLLADDFLVVNADVLTDADVGTVLRRHRDAAAALTVAVARRDFPIRYGVVECAAGDMVTGLREKPVATVDVNLGMYALSRPEVEPLLAATSGRLDMTDLIALLLDARRPVVAARLDCRWYDIGVEADLYAAREAFAADPAAFLGAPTAPRG
jgi:NDP-sugar pyrophosphorylase family protein